MFNLKNLLGLEKNKRPISDNNKALSADEWGNLYNKDMLEQVVGQVQRDAVSAWSKELLKITNPGEHVLEIGCGSGMTSLFLSKNHREVTAIDYSKESLALLQTAAAKTGYKVNALYADAKEALPFPDKTFDLAFQAGLLEHFSKEERINMLRIWKPVCKKMVSMIPNANSIAYRAGKALQEQNGTWKYGLEIPQSTLWDEFSLAGYSDIYEYTIGAEHALTFLPQHHYLRIALQKWIDEFDIKDDLCGQGYLLVTIGVA